MLTLDLSNTPRWVDLAPGVRVELRPLTTALMVATRADPGVEALPAMASEEDRALAFAKALARRAVLRWEGIGDEDGFDSRTGRKTTTKQGDQMNKREKSIICPACSTPSSR